MKKIFISLMLCVLMVLCGCDSNTNTNLNNLNEQEDSLPNMTLLLSAAYEYAECTSPWAEHGSDWAYISLDSNPYKFNYTDYPKVYKLYDIGGAIKKINEKLGLPEMLFYSIVGTDSEMGIQNKKYKSLGIEVSWFSHPRGGLEITYSIIVD